MSAEIITIIGTAIAVVSVVLTTTWGRPRSFHAPYQSSPPIRVPVHPARAWARLSGVGPFYSIKAPFGGSFLRYRNQLAKDNKKHKAEEQHHDRDYNPADYAQEFGQFVLVRHHSGGDSIALDLLQPETVKTPLTPPGGG